MYSGGLSKVAPYIIALAVTAAAVALRWLLDPWLGPHLPLVALFGAVAAAVWYGGYRPALAATSLGYLACSYFFIEPRGGLAPADGREYIGLVLYLLTCSIIIGFGDALRRARRRADERQNLLQVTFASIGDAVITTETGGRITTLNPAAESLTGWTQTEAVGHPLDAALRIVTEQTAVPVENPVVPALREGVVVTLADRCVLVRPDGTERTIDGSAAPIRDARGRVLGCVLVLRDTTDRRQAERALLDREHTLAADVAAAARMQEVSTHVIRAGDVSALLYELLDAAIEITGADMGNIQLLEDGALKIVAHRGFQAPFLEFFGAVHASEAACGTALERGERVIVEDVADSPIFAGTPAQAVMLAAGARSVESTPLIGRTGRVLGVLSTHYRTAHRPDQREVRLLDVLAREAADLTERMWAEVALRESEQRFGVLANAAPVLIWRSGADGSCTWFNRQWLEFVGRTLEQELGDGWAQNVHREDVERVVKTYVTSFDARRPFSMEYRLRRHDGEYRWVLDCGVPLQEPGGEFMGYVGSCIDITDMKTTAAALAAEIEMTRAYFETAAEGVVIVDPAGRIVRVNARGNEMFGYAPGQLVGQPVEVLLPERFRAAHAGHRANYFAAPRRRSVGLGLDLYACRKDGTEFPIEISLSPIETAEGRAAMALVTDITERRSLELAARRHEKLAALATLSAGIAHELNNPIGIISTRVELMLQDAASAPLPGDTVEDLHVLYRNIQRVVRIARGLLTFARHAPEERGPLSVNGVIDETLLLLGKQLAMDGVRVRVTLDQALEPIDGDGNALQQVLTNLLLNARDAMPRGGTVSVETARDADRPGWLRLTVADTGHGMTPEALRRLFEPFYTTKTSGTGLGLSVSQRIIQEHGGSVDVHSEPGSGTRFVIRLPVAAIIPSAP